MDPKPPPLPPLPTSTIPQPTKIHLNPSDSMESSPRSHAALDHAFHNESLPHVPGAKLRLMCSYGGHIIPRPHDKTLCYVGGETRMVAIDRHCTLASLSSRLSHALLKGRPFALKYQLPNEDLDSLVSVTTDEDLENMIEEYDRIANTPSSPQTLHPCRIRLFLFFNKPETAASMGSLLDDAKSETWFVDALNGSGLLPRNLSDSATMDNCLVHLDDNDHHDLETQETINLLQVSEPKTFSFQVQQEVQHIMSDSPAPETNSSSCSTPSLSNLPPIRVRVEDHMVGIMEEQLAQMNFAQALPPVPPLPITMASTHLSDDDRQDHGCASANFRKPPLAPLQPVQLKAGTCYNLPSPDSVASGTSVTSATSQLKVPYYQDQSHVATTQVGLPSPDTKIEIPILNSQLQQVHDSTYQLPPQMDQPQVHQQQFVRTTSAHYVATQVAAPIQSYQQIQHQYPVYVMPIVQPTQPYMSMHPNASHPHAPIPVYPKTVGVQNPDQVSGATATAAMYGTMVGTNTPALVQIPNTTSNQIHQQYVGYPANYGYEYPNSASEQVYYTQQQSATPIIVSTPVQYQTMTSVASVTLPDASNPNPMSSADLQ